MAALSDKTRGQKETKNQKRALVWISMLPFVFGFSFNFVKRKWRAREETRSSFCLFPSSCYH